MKRQLPTILFLLAFTAAVFGADNSIEQTLRDLDAQWSKAAAAKDVDKTVSFYSDDAVVLPPNQATVTGKSAVRDLWKGLLDSVTTVSWKADRVEVAKSGDMAFITGTYQLSSKDAVGGTNNDRGKYLVVYEKQADGTWKCGADMFSSDLPASGERK